MPRTNAPFFGAATDAARLRLGSTTIERLQDQLRREPDGVLQAAPAPKGILTHAAGKAVEKVAHALGASDPTAAQLAQSVESFNLDYNPLSAADEVGTQLGHAANGDGQFSKAALASGALNTALAAAPEIAAPAAKALAKTGVGKAVTRALTDPAFVIEKPLAGAPTRIKGRGYVGPSPALRETARDYASGSGIDYQPLDTYRAADPDRGAAIAKAYAAMRHAPADPAVQKSYKALADETVAQYGALKKNGYSFDFYPEDGSDPYPSPWDAAMDLRKNNRMLVYPTASGYGAEGITPQMIAENPMLSTIPGETWSGKPVTVNDAFRAVHDAFGHAKDDTGFRADGEETAWASHMPMFSQDAQKALTTETRGQNSWLNFGPNGEANRTAKTADTVFADQKIGLLPEWTLDANGMPPKADWSLDRIAAIKAATAGAGDTYVAHMSPEEFLGLTVSPDGRKALQTTASLGPFDKSLYDQACPISLGVQFGGEPSAWQKANGVSIPSSVMAHDGRHRMAALQAAGVDKVPVLIQAMNKSAPSAFDGITLSPQRGRLATQNNGDTPAIIGGLTPLDQYEP